MKHTCKKLLTVLLAVAMVISLMPSLVLTAFAENDAVITVGTQTAAPGEEITVPVSITDNPGFATFTLTPTYDTTNLTLTTVDKGSLLSSPSASFLVGENIVFGNSVNTTGDGELLKLHFTVSADAAAGNYPISLALTNNDSGNFCDETPAVVPVTFTAGGITVEVQDNTAPTLTSVTPAEGAVPLGTGESFVLTVTANDDKALYELEIDHSMEGTLPEFSVYADSANPYGTPEDAAAFAAAGVSVTYGGGVWTIDFGPTATDAFVNNGGITFYMVIKDMAGNSWGSMYDVTDENTFAYVVTRQVNNTVWDGSIDVSWYNSTGTEFTLTTAAQFAGFAAIVNNKPDGSAAGAVTTGVNPAIPADDFLGKTVRLAADLDLGGVETVAGGLSGTTWTTPVWGGQQWVPIATYTGSGNSSNGQSGRPFKGTFDGQFHSISNIYIPGDPTKGGDSPETNGHALFGDLGHDGVVKNIIIKSGYIRGARYTAGIAGRNWGYVSGCANYATIETDGDRSGGGITGVNYENTPGDALSPTVINCYNAGTIMKGDRRWPGGITGDNEGIIQNCYNIGKGMHKTSYDLMGGILGGGHSNSGQIINCYSLSGDGQPTAIIAANNSIPEGCALKTQEELKATTYGSGDILTLLGLAFKADTTNINNGYPILRGQVGDAAPTMVSISIATPPTNVTYDVGDVFNPAGMVVLAVYSDGSATLVTDYTYPTTALTAGTDSVTISYNGMNAIQSVTVGALSRSITIANGIENGTVEAPESAAEGSTVTVTVTPREGYHLLADSLTYTVSGQDPVAITATDGVYSFVMPAADIIITAAFTDALWTGSGTQTDPYMISTADGLAALATYTNEGNTTKDFYWELANDIDLATVCSESLGSWTPIGNYVLPSPSVPSVGEAHSYPAASGYAFLGDFNGNGYEIRNLYVSSDGSNLGLFGTVGGNDNHNGTDGYGIVHNFKLHGRVINTLTQSASAPGDTYADFIGAVCGLLNAGGTISDIINYATVEAKNAFEVGGIVGFAGTPVLWGNMNGGNGSGAKNYANYTDNPSGYNTFILRCGNEAQIWGYYKEGGIVGENAATVMYCYNTGHIKPHMHGSGGGWGGIAGRNGNNDRACEESVIAYCYNTAEITDGGYNDDHNETIKGFAGIAGKTYGGNGHNTLYNCYNIGEIPEGRDDGAAYGSITTNLEAPNKDEVVYNNYSLDTPLIHNNGGYNGEQYMWETGIVKSEAQFKTTTYGDDDILALLGPAFTADTANINGGYPVLRWQVGLSMPSAVSISITTPPTKVAYDGNEVFDPAGMVVIATYSDGSKGLILDYTYSTDPLTVGVTGIDITYGGFTVTQLITVNSLSLTGLAITTNPNNMLYAADETFDPAGMVVTATYNENAATNAEIAYDKTGAAGYTYSVDETGLLTVSYTEGGVIKTATLQLSKLDSNAPTAVNGVYQLQNANDMIWFTNQVNEVGNTALNVELLNSINLGKVDWTPIGTNNKAYCGDFNGNNNTITLNNTFTNSKGYYAGIFGYVGAETVDTVVYTANIHDLKTTGQITTTGYFSAIGGMVAYASTGTFTNCVNQATINATASVGGIAGYAYPGSSFTNCVNEGDITTTSSNCGGIAGYASSATFTSCTNSADIIGSSSTAGIAGNIADVSNISYCTNSGAVSGSGNVSGICGSISGDDVNIQYCSNKGSITGTGNAIAGIAGKGYGTIDNCYNTGAVQGTYYVGGIVGRNNTTAVSNCYNTGAVKGTDESSSVYKASGGIAGAGDTGSFTNCYNSGAVTANYAGALVGASNRSIFTLTNCYYVTGTASVAYNERTEGYVVEDGVYGVTATELYGKASELGSEFKTGLVSPILTWQTAPTLTNASASNLSATGATISFTSDKAGTYYYVVLRATAEAPTTDTVMNGTSGSAAAAANSFTVTGLSASTAYKAYIVAEDAGAASEITTATFTTSAAPTGGGGGGGGATAAGGEITSNTLSPDATAVNGSATVQVGGSDMSDAIGFAQETNADSIIITPNITGTVSSVHVNVPTSSLSEMASQTDAGLVINTPVGSLSVPNDALASIASQASGGTVDFSMESVDTSSLTAKQQASVGDDPVYDISITSNGESISSFDGESITISLPYTLQPGEDPSGVTIWYLNDAGELTQMPCTYDAATGTVRFTTNHLSYYVISYDKLAAWANPYTDVHTTDWYYDAVVFAAVKELFTGTSTTAFSPDMAMTRAMLVTVLYRLEGKPAVIGTNSFTDVEDGQWYTDAVVWANQNGIVTGYGDDLFGTKDNITREQMAAILYRYAEYKGYDVSAAANLSGYSDAQAVSDWAEAAVGWANAEELITGTTATTLSPSGSATRAQVAMTLMRFVNRYVGQQGIRRR